MEYILGVIIVILIIYFMVDKFVLKTSKQEVKLTVNEKLPYKTTI